MGQDKDRLTGERNRNKPPNHQQNKAINKPKQNQPSMPVMQRHSPTPSQISAQLLSKKQIPWKKYTTTPPVFLLLSMAF